MTSPSLLEVPIQLSGLSLFGGKGDGRAAGPALPGSPLIGVRGLAFFGGFGVKERPERRNLLELIRARRSKPTSV